MSHPDAFAETNAGPITPEVVAGFTTYIDQGGLLIKDGKYAEAMNHFKNAKELAKVGRRFALPREKITMEPPKPENFRSLVNFVAANSWSKANGSVELSNILYVKRSPEDSNIQVLPLPRELQHDIALIYLEEWLHCLQDIQGTRFTGQWDHEIDVAVYMKKHDIPMTEAFLDKYGRKEALAKIFP